jgi:hypothetical protein
MKHIHGALRNWYPYQTKSFLTIIVLLGSFGWNCASIRTNFQPLEKVREAAVSAGSTYDPYLVTNGEWLANQPIMVNRDYDFLMSQAIEDAGPGLAANKRMTGNQDIAGKLTSIPTVAWKAIFEKHVQECGKGCNNLDGATVRLYGLLYGDEKARLQSILEIEQTDETSSKNAKSVYRFIGVSEERPLEGDASWLGNNGQLILDSMKSSLSKLVSLTRQYLQLIATNQVPSTTMGECPIGGTYRATGSIINQDEQQLILIVENMKRTILVCERQ